MKSSDQMKQRGLSATRRSDYAQKLSGLDLQVDVFERN
jgi:hypothetical protein